MDNVQIENVNANRLAPIAADDSVVLDIARGLDDLFYLAQSTENGSRLADVFAERGAFVSQPSAPDVAFVRDVLAGKSDTDIYEREARDLGQPIVSVEEYAVASCNGTLPTMAAPPYEHAGPRRHRRDAMRRAFVLATADGIAARDEWCRADGMHWFRGSVRRGTPEA